MRISKEQRKSEIEWRDTNILNEIKLNIFFVCLGNCMDRIAIDSFFNHEK